MNSLSGPANHNLIYLYDLPKKEYTSVKLAELLKEQCGVELERQPTVRRDISRPFYQAIITIDDNEKYKKAVEALRYFELDGKPCRGLPYDNELLGSNIQKLVDHNVFVRKIPKDMSHNDFETQMEKFGKVKSLKISRDPDYQSREYGFVCFQDPEAAGKAIESQGESEALHTVKYQLKDKRDARKAFNNIYCKNLPEEWSDEEVKQLFVPFGRIESLKTNKNDKGLYCFVCFHAEDPNDREYGPVCAKLAVDQLNGRDMGNGKILYVREALKLSERENERMRENRKFKNSKKRCNLYVKGFPESYTEDDLKKLFENHGEIESLRLFPADGAKKPYAFVCYKAPDQATTAKNELTKSTTNNRALIINHYEIKEQREIIAEDQKDKQDFMKYKATNQKMPGWETLASKEELLFYLQYILSNHLPKVKQQAGGPRQQHNQPRKPMPGQFQGQDGRGRPAHHMQPMPNAMPGNVMPNAGMPMPGAAVGQQPMRPMPGNYPGVPQNMPAASGNTTRDKYLAACYSIFPSVVPANTMYKSQVGTVIYDFVSQITGRERAPKITGMLIDLPINDIHQFMQNYDVLVERVHQAEGLLATQSVPQAQQ